MRAKIRLLLLFALCAALPTIAQQEGLRPRDTSTPAAAIDTPVKGRATTSAAMVDSTARSAAAREDAAEEAAEPDTLRHQFRIAFDLSKPVLNTILDTRTSYEIAADYYLGRDLYAVLEVGFGDSRFSYDDLRYSSRNAFVRLGVEKSLLVRLGPTDWDGAFAGIRYGYAPVHRSEATFSTRDTVWGATSGSIPALTRGVSWMEITGGVRVEIVKNIQLGWTVRGKFLFSQSAFTDLRPSFIAGYGQGDKNTVFDFNVWVAYALRWR